MSNSFKRGVKLAELCAKGKPPFERERINLCEWYVKLVRPGKELPEDQFQCIVPMKMTKFDIKNYFEKIYNIRVHRVDTRIQAGKMKPVEAAVSNKMYRKPDYKVAYITMVDQTFTFPTMFRDFLKQREEQIQEKEEEEKQMRKEREQKEEEDRAKLLRRGLVKGEENKTEQQVENKGDRLIA